MTICPSCSADIPAGDRSCPACAAPLGDSLTPTRFASSSAPATSPVPGSAAPPGATHPPDSSPPGRHARFAPGMRLGDRYLVMGILGKGGMGEVYRVDDLKLGHPVALKLLPERLAADPAMLARFHHEVRIARQVTHPNVCRVHDIGEADGMQFLTMEYVDGEDLAALLRRIGRLSGERAVEIARQLCAGLAAAHERGVLHRDLKPANVMIDGRGKVRITDFGLAGVADDIRGVEIRSGTPAYMAPEQLAGTEVSIRSDLYALGLVLFELFTGKPAWKAESLAELTRLHQDGAPASPSSLVRDLDPAVERAILRCLEREPRHRPASALAVAAALPGGDPLAAALAAGETPSPEMVAAAHVEGALSPARGWLGFGAVLALLAAVALLSGRATMLGRVPLEKPPAVLADRAADLIRNLGYADPPGGRTYGFAEYTDYLRYLEETRRGAERWQGLGKLRPPGVQFWYRQSPLPLVPARAIWTGGRVLIDDPPPLQSGMITLVLDPAGRLLHFMVVPPQVETETRAAGGSRPAVPEPDWDAAFRAAGVDRGSLSPVEPRWLPISFADTRRAWEGTVPELAGERVRAEAASYRGRIVYFTFVGPWTRPLRMAPYQPSAMEKIGQAATFLLTLGALAGAAILARRNWRLGRGDRLGAMQLALFVLGLFLASWAISAQHVADLALEYFLFVSGLAMAALAAGIVWLVYIALEPYVRRLFPDTIVSWSRLMAGRFRDPLVGRDILVGTAAGVLFALLPALRVVGGEMIGTDPPRPLSLPAIGLLGVRGALGQALNALAGGIQTGFILLLMVILLRVILRKPWLVSPVFVLLFGAAVAAGSGNPYVSVGLGMALAALVFLLLTRFGLLAGIAAFTTSNLLGLLPVTADFGAWYGGAALFGFLLVIGLAFYGFHAALAGFSLLGSREDA